MLCSRICAVCGSRLSWVAVLKTGFSVDEHRVTCPKCATVWEVKWEHGYLIMMGPSMLVVGLLFYTPLRQLVPTYLKLLIVGLFIPAAVFLGACAVPIRKRDDNQDAVG